MNENADSKEIVVPGVADTRAVPLSRLAAEAAGSGTAADRSAHGLRRALPAEGGRVPIAAFGSSI